MYFLHLIETNFHEPDIAIQAFAAMTIYFTVVIAAVALALVIAFEHMVTDEPIDDVIDQEDQPLPRAA